MAGRVRAEIKRLNTPDARNTLDLFGLVDFDPLPVWAFTFEYEVEFSQLHGSHTKSRTLNATQAQQELDSWLQVRHKIAHGDALSAAPRFQGLVSGRSRQGEPRLTRRDADRCASFFRMLVDVTTAEAGRLHP
jgi:hypothetical protein